MTPPADPSAPEPPSADSEEEKFPFWRARSVVLPGPFWDMPEGEVATPALSAEYRRRLRRLNLVQVPNVLVFVPLAAWAGLRFVHRIDVQVLYFITAGAVAIYSHVSAQRNFRCPVCEKTFLIIQQSIYNVSPRRRAMAFSCFRWCEYCGTRFELYPPSAPDPPKDDDDYAIL